MIRLAPKSSSCASLGLLLVICAFIEVGHTQTGCPPSDDGLFWPTGKVVRYTVDNLPNDTLKLAAQEALTQWNAANQTNGSNVRFESGGNDLIFREAEIAEPPGATMERVGGFEPRPRDPNNGTLLGADIYIDLGAEANVNGQYVRVLDPSKPGYWDALVGLFLHEIGHSLGLANAVIPTDDPLTCGGVVLDATVMNPFCGINDMGWGGPGGAQPDHITACDNGVIANRYPEPEDEIEEYPAEFPEEDFDCYDVYRVTYTYQIVNGNWILTSVSYDYLTTECYPLEDEG